MNPAHAVANAPWLAEVWQQLNLARVGGRLPHAVLLGGAPGMGHELLAEQLLAAVICEQVSADGLACGQCRGCHLRLREAHEDIHRIVPQEERRSLSVEQIRDLSELLAFAPQRATRRVALIQPAEAMTVAAGNALLKTLEEPPAGSLLILVSGQPRSLLPTLRSRCGQWLVQTPPLAQTCAWLQQQSGCTLAAAHWRLVLNQEAPLAALHDELATYSTELLPRLLQVLASGSGASELLRGEKTRLPAVQQVIRAVLVLAARPPALPLPAPLPELLALTARADSSSLQSVARDLWQAQRWSGTGVREDLQLLAVLERLRQAVNPGTVSRIRSG